MRAASTGKAGWEINRDAAKEMGDIWEAIQDVMAKQPKTEIKLEEGHDEQRLH